MINESFFVGESPEVAEEEVAEEEVAEEEVVEEEVVEEEVALPTLPEAPQTYVLDGPVGQNLDCWAEGRKLFSLPYGTPLTLTQAQIAYLKQTNKI